MSMQLFSVDPTESVEGIPRWTGPDLLPRHVQLKIAVKPGLAPYVNRWKHSLAAGSDDRPIFDRG